MDTVFCDWLSIYQDHFRDIPNLFAGRVFSVDQDGKIEWDTCKKLQHKGSFETKLLISSDGNRVTLTGNVGRFNRSDNVFGYSVSDCVKIANATLVELGLPPFEDKPPMAINGKNGKDAGFQATGAVITRVDLTRNWATGSPGNASQVVRYMQGFKLGKFEPESYGCTGVSWGEGSKYVYNKLYDKAADYVRHLSKDNRHHDEKLYAFILTNGVLRQELTLKSRYLGQNNLWRMSQWVPGMEQKVLALYSDPYKESINVDQFLEIDGRAGELAVAWRDGADLKKRLAKNTFYRYRRELLKYGIDIAVPSNVSRLKTRVEIITLSPLQRPSWYELPQVA